MHQAKCLFDAILYKCQSIHSPIEIYKFLRYDILRILSFQLDFFELIAFAKNVEARVGPISTKKDVTVETMNPIQIFQYI